MGKNGVARHEDGNGEVCTGGAWLFVVCCIFLEENQRGGQDGYTWFEGRSMVGDGEIGRSGQDLSIDDVIGIHRKQRNHALIS